MSRVLQSIGHNIYFGDNAFVELDELLRTTRYTGCRKFIMVDENTIKHCLPVLLAATEELADAEIIETESGEKNKSLDVCFQLWSAMSKLQADRKSLLLNLGGGVI